MAGASFIAQLRVLPVQRASDAVMMTRKTGPFPIPEPPADFAGAQWAPHCFPPFPINVNRAVAEVKEILKEEDEKMEAAAAAPAAAPPAEPAAPAADKSTFTVTLKNPDSKQVVEYDPKSDYFLLDYLDELENADDYADLPYACRAGSCSACAAKVVSGTVDSSACSFLSEDQKADGWILTCTAKPTSDVVLETHKEDDLY